MNSQEIYQHTIVNDEKALNQMKQQLRGAPISMNESLNSTPTPGITQQNKLERPISPIQRPNKMPNNQNNNHNGSYQDPLQSSEQKLQDGQRDFDLDNIQIDLGNNIEERHYEFENQDNKIQSQNEAKQEKKQRKQGHNKQKQQQMERNITYDSTQAANVRQNPRFSEKSIPFDQFPNPLYTKNQSEMNNFNMKRDQYYSSNVNKVNMKYQHDQQMGIENVHNQINFQSNQNASPYQFYESNNFRMTPQGGRQWDNQNNMDTQGQNNSFVKMYTYSHDNEVKTKSLNNTISKINNLDEPLYQENTKKFTPLEISYLKQAKKILNTGFFYTHLPASYSSFIVPEYIKPLPKTFLMEYLLPLIAVLLIHIFLWGIQLSVGDYCFQNSSFCPCQTFGVSLWTFFKQMIGWKLGVIVSKKILMVKTGQERNPWMETFLMYFVGIGTDFILVVGIGLNQDWQFLLIMFLIGVLVTVHTIRFKQFSQLWNKGKGLFWFDINLFAIVGYAIYALPAIYLNLINQYQFDIGRNAFMYLYPLMELVMEVITNQVLNRCNYCEFFQYQLSMFLLGLRVGVITSVSTSSFEFWYLACLFLLKRVFESTSIVYIQLRKLLYKNLPDNLKHLASMQEIPDSSKGREGFYLENILWIVLYYWWFLTDSIESGDVKQLIVVDNCSFKINTLLQNITWDRAFLAWIFYLVTQLISFVLNSNSRLDMIKWVGAPQHNIFENICTRMFGWYLFQVALVAAYSFLRIDQNGLVIF